MAPPKADSAEGIILHFLNEQNRPLNVQNVADALQKHAIKKSTAQKVLDALVESGQISAKEYGKQKIYLAKQDQFHVLSAEELLELKSDNEKLKKEYEVEKASLSGLEADLRMLESNLTLEKIKEKTTKTSLEVKNAEEKLRKLQEGAILVDPEEREKIQGACASRLSEWRKRKKAFKDLWDMITETLPKDLKEFKEELGIELDEDVQVNLQDYAHLIPKKQKR